MRYHEVDVLASRGHSMAGSRLVSLFITAAIISSLAAVQDDHNYFLPACQGQNKTGAAPNKKRIDWYTLDQEVNAAMRNSKDGKVHRQKAGAIDDLTVAELMLIDFDLAVRDGREGDAKKALSQLKTHLVGVDRPEETLSAAADFLIGREQWSLAKYFLELYPVAHPGWGYVFIKHWSEELKSDKNSGANAGKNSGPSAVDHWLDARYKADANAQYWLNERMRYRRDQGTAAVFLKELENKIRSSASTEKSSQVTYKEVMSFLSVLDVSAVKIDLSWLPSSYMPALLYHQAKLGHALVTSCPKASIEYLLKAERTPVTAADRNLFREEARHRSAVGAQFEDAEVSIKLAARQTLAQAYKNDGQAENAQKILVQLNEEYKKHGGVMPLYSLSQGAGQIQSQLTQRPLEASIKAAEPENKNSYDYWLGRARYYQGRKNAGDDAKAREALDKALSLTVLPVNTASEAEIMARQIVVDAYAWYLNNQNRPEEAAAFYWKEYDSTKYAPLRSRIISSVLHMDRNLITYKNERIFAFLSEQQSWKYTEQHIMQALAESTGADKKSAGATRLSLWSRLEKLAMAPTLKGEARLSRLSNLGWVMTRYEESSRALPLLKEAVAGLKNKDSLEEARFTLFEANLDLGNWLEAEKLWPQARTRLTPAEEPVWLSKIAVAAARAGKYQEALRLWKEKDRLDKTCLGPLSELAAQGAKMKKPLLDYYLAMQKENPGSTIPREARKILEK